MIMTVEELKKYILTDKSIAELQMMLDAVELLIRQYTHNNFQDRRYRSTGTVSANQIYVKEVRYFTTNDTVMINEDLCVITDINDSAFTLDKTLLDSDNALITKVVYPADIINGVVNMIKWDISNRSKVGIQSETISRHSVSYFNMDGDNSLMGYPKSLLGFLKPYIKARF